MREPVETASASVRIARCRRWFSSLAAPPGGSTAWDESRPGWAEGAIVHRVCTPPHATGWTALPPECRWTSISGAAVGAPQVPAGPQALRPRGSDWIPVDFRYPVAAAYPRARPRRPRQNP